MDEMPSRKLPKAARREQLLETALTILRAQGADALTLGVLAERAGVSKPIAYEHFGTRAGLLIALCRQIDERQISILRDVLARAPRGLTDMADVISEAYMACCEAVGPEWHAIAAALKGDEQMDAAQQELIDRYVQTIADALAPFSPIAPSDLHLRCVGFVGAAETISRDMLRGRTDRGAAVAGFAALIVGGVRG